MKKGLKRILSTVLTAAMLASSFVVTNMGAVAVNAASITAQSGGWHETAYTEWLPVSGAASYEAYVKASSAGSYTKLDDELVRQYDTFCRADALGLAAGTYNMKIVAKDSSGAELASWESGAVTVDNYIRDGFAFSDGGSSSGAYNDDGTLKSNAIVFYVTDENKDTITCDVTTSTKGTTTCVGMGAIIKALEKGYETRPMNFRFIGQVTVPADEQTLNQLDIKKAKNPITLEGVGNDAFALFGFNLVGATNLEVRNFGFKDMTTKDEDGVTVKDASERIWVHNNDFFYGGQGSDNDQAKGDGSVDLKGTSTKMTISDNHYWDAGKVNLCGLGESADYEITYSRNWFDHSDSRHPRVRTGSVHVYNNYYDGVAKYGAGACTGASLFVEGNYFRNTKKPVMSSMQGTDAQGTGTFSKEAGGIIKMYDNIMVGSYTYIEANNSDGTLNQDSDGYTVANRSDTVPSSLTTVKGGTSYNNFDTARDLGVDASGVLAAKDVPAYVTANAGRINGGNFRFTFDDSVDDEDYNVNLEMKSALGSYKYQADNSYVSSKSATGIDGSTFYADRAEAYETKVASLATETDPSGNKATGGGSVSSFDLVLDGKTDISTGSITSNVTGLGTNGAFSILASSSASVTISSSKGIQLGGAGNFAAGTRLISVDVAEAGTIYATSSSTSTDVRTLNIADASGNIIGTISTGTSDGVALPSAGTYYIYSASKGINVTKVAVAYGSSEDSSQTTTKGDSSQTTTKTEPTTQATTNSENSSQTTTKSVENSTETTTNTVIDDGFAAAGKYVLGTSASGGDFNITSKTVEAGNVNFALRDIQSTGGRIRSEEDGGYITFELEKTAKISIMVNSGRDDVKIRDYDSADTIAEYPAGSESTHELSAGSYIIESVNDSNAEIAYIIVSYDSTPDPSGVIGDANNDGKVNADDVNMVLDYASGKISAVTNPELADVSGDGTVTAYDAYLIGKIILGLK
ncbi:MAG: dockerin type I domain-containing protein [Clostridia bacterium]|nr:dockerin type I domain-containing protein [Clostridia bacterium]